MMRTLAEAVKEGYTVEEVDAVFGPATGRPKSAVFRTADVVGLDTLMHVTKNCFDALPGDERRDVFDPPPVLTRWSRRSGSAARPSRASTRRSATHILQLDLKTMEYGPQTKPRFASIGAARGTDDVDEKLRRMLAGDDRAAALARTVTLRDADLLGEPPRRDRRRHRRHRPRAALGLRLGARAVRDLGRARRQGDRREDGGGRLHRPRLGEGADRRAGRGDALLPPGGAGQARSSSASAAASRRSPTDPRAPVARRRPRRRRRGRAQRQRVDPRPRRRRLLPRVPRQDERHRPRHRGDDDEGRRPRRTRRRRRW